MAVVGLTSIGFGVTSAADSAAACTVTGYSCTTKQEVKELRNSAGAVVAASFHKKTDDISIDVVGAPSIVHNPGSALHGAYNDSSADEILIDEVSVDISAEGHRSTSIKATGYYQ